MGNDELRPGSTGGDLAGSCQSLGLSSIAVHRGDHAHSPHLKGEAKTSCQHWAAVKFPFFQLARGKRTAGNWKGPGETRSYTAAPARAGHLTRVKDISLQTASFALRADLGWPLQPWVGFKKSEEIDHLSTVFYLVSPCFMQQPSSEKSRAQQHLV